MRNILLVFALWISSWNIHSQTPFNIQLEPIDIEGVGGIQSYAFGQHNGKWLIVGGRLDGLHQRQPFAAFDASGNNTQLMVIDPVAGQSWATPLSSLSVGMREQLSSTNMEFNQEGDYLYVIGGYGYSSTKGEHTTYANLTAINVPATIEAIVNGTDFAENFRQITDPQFAVTGGHLNKIGAVYYLVGGQKFEGSYNPMGPDHGPGFTQEYTDAIRKFEIDDDGTTLNIRHLEGITDTENLHRRDYNVVPQIMPNGEEGLTAFSGVFQKTANVPFLNCVNIDAEGYEVNNSFSQYYNHYHCAVLPVFGAEQNEMHTVFFGGIAQYYEADGVLVQDDEVPFVKTIARVTRTADGTMTEYKLPVEMPALLGASSELIPIEGLSKYANGVLKLDDLEADTTLVGYIYGGISSSAKNIFWSNTGAQSEASSQIFKVFVVKEKTVGIDEINLQSIADLRMQMYPNPYNGVLNIDFQMAYQSEVELQIFDIEGKIVHEQKVPKNETVVGKNHLSLTLKEMEYGTVLLVKLATKKDHLTQKLIIND
ncbi:MAG: T9SS type A sorting domain-containing protein [Chitinophagales bacterium]